MNRKLLSCAAAVVILAAPALAILGIGDIVYDPTNYEEAVAQLLQLEQEYSQLVQTYGMIKNQYDLMVQMAKHLSASRLLRYRALSSPWTLLSAENTYGTTAAWQNAINTGQSVAPSYGTAIEALQEYGGALENVPADQRERLLKDYGSLELQDGATRSAIQTLGELRAQAPAVDTAIQALETDSLSADPDLNTELAVLNKINAADLIHIRSVRDTNKLLGALAEHQIVEAKRQRDAEARAFNAHIQFMAKERGELTAQSTNASAAMLAWRMP